MLLCNAAAASMSVDRRTPAKTRQPYVATSPRPSTLFHHLIWPCLLSMHRRRMVHHRQGGMRTFFASSSAVAAPMPLLAPVITTVRWSGGSLYECAACAANALHRSVLLQCACVARRFDQTVAARETDARNRLPVSVNDADPPPQHS
jgi:hypothetical protein